MSTTRCPLCGSHVSDGHACSTVPAQVDHRGRRVVPVSEEPKEQQAPKGKPVRRQG